MKYKLIGLMILSVSIVQVKAYDTLKITIRQADSMFLSSNYQLLASALNIEAQKAQLLQVKLYPNPVFTADLNAYDPQHNKHFHVGGTGQKGFQLEQLIILGGKRKSQIELAKTNATVAELEFQEIIRQLKFQLHAGLHSLDQQWFLLQQYNNQLGLLNTILDAYQEQAIRGNIPLKDVVRLKGVYLNLNNNRAELLKLIFEELAKVQTILQTSDIVVPVIEDSDLHSVIKTKTFEELNDLALLNRPDYLMVTHNKTAAAQYYELQRKLSVPDVTLTGSYDQRGGAFENQINIGFTIPLPLWNRNQGNIKASKFLLKRSEYTEQNVKNSIHIELQNNLALYNQTVSEYQTATALYNEDFEITFRGMSDNFQKRNVSLLEFVDFFEAYNNALEEIARIKIQLAVSAELLNLTIGKELY